MTDMTVQPTQPDENLTTHEASMMDRIANQFSKVPAGSPPARNARVQQEAGPADEVTEGEAEPTHEELDWEGEVLTVPKSLKASVMMQKDYTQKTSELAEQRRQYDIAREAISRAQLDSQFHQSVAQELNQINVIDSYLKEVNKLNWAQMNTDQLIRTRAEIDQVREQRSLLNEAVQQKRAKYDEAVKAHRAGLLAKSKEVIAKSIPNFSEETEKAIRAFAIAEGLTEAETDSVLVDPRSTRVLWKAMQWDKVQANVGKADKAISRTLRTSPRGEPMPEATKAALNYRKAMKNATSGSQKAALIEQRLVAGSIFNRKGH